MAGLDLDTLRLASRTPDELSALEAAIIEEVQDARRAATDRAVLGGAPPVIDLDADDPLVTFKLAGREWHVMDLDPELGSRFGALMESQAAIHSAEGFNQLASFLEACLPKPDRAPFREAMEAKGVGVLRLQRVIIAVMEAATGRPSVPPQS